MPSLEDLMDRRWCSGGLNGVIEMTRTGVEVSLTLDGSNGLDPHMQ